MMTSKLILVIGWLVLESMFWGNSKLLLLFGFLDYSIGVTEQNCENLHPENAYDQHYPYLRASLPVSTCVCKLSEVCILIIFTLGCFFVFANGLEYILYRREIM